MQIPHFTEKKFKSLSLKKQHKECANLLRKIYLQMIEKKQNLSFFQVYENFCRWMGIDFYNTSSLKEISDLFHSHAKKASWKVRENDLLPIIQKNDNNIAKKDFANIAIYLDHIRSAHNVGSIIRTTEALRLGKIYFSKNTPFVDNKKVIKTSMGADKLVSCYNNFCLEDLPRPFIGLETAKSAHDIFTFSFPEKFTLILGNEEYGISDSMLKQIDLFVKIPLFGCKNSLNVACSFAIASGQIAPYFLSPISSATAASTINAASKA